MPVPVLRLFWGASPCFKAFWGTNLCLNGFFGCKTPIFRTFEPQSALGGTAKAAWGRGEDGDRARVLARDAALILGGKRQDLRSQEGPAEWL